MKLITTAILLLLQFTPWGGLRQPALERWVGGQAGIAELDLSYPLPAKVSSEPLSLGAASILAIDVQSGRELYSQNPDARRPIASITKLITALTIRQDHQLSEEVTVRNLPAYLPEEVRLNLVNGQKFKLEDLLRAALIPSANDAADVLAIHSSGSIEGFAQKMNAYMRKWGINDTNFVTANGLADNYSTARSLAKLVKLALHDPFISQTVRQGQATIRDASGQSYVLVSTNRLLADSRFEGLKTGYTPSAGQSFLGLANIEGHSVATVVLGSPDRFTETVTLAGWIERSYQWQ